MAIRIFPHSMEEFSNELELIKWLNGRLRQNMGKYHLRGIQAVGKIPPGNIVLFRFKNNIVGHAIVKKDIVKKTQVINGVTYHGIIQFVASSITVYKKPIAINRIEKVTNRDLSKGRPYYKFENPETYYKILEIIYG